MRKGSVMKTKLFPKKGLVWSEAVNLESPGLVGKGGGRHWGPSENRGVG